MTDPIVRPVPRESPGLLPLLAWFTGTVYFLYAWVLRVAPSVMIEELMRDFAVGAALLGHLSAAYFYGYAGMQLPAGILLDRYGPRRLMSGSAAVCAGACVLFATADSMAAATVGRFLIGASVAFSVISAMAVAAQWFPANRFAILTGLAMTMGMAGGVLGQAPLRLAIETSDWRTTMLMLAGGALAISLAAWLTVRDRRRGSARASGVLNGLRIIARDRQTWLVAFAGLATAAPLLGFAGLWGVPFLETVHGLPRATAAALTSIIFAGWGVGAPVFGWLTDHTGRQRLPLIAGMALQAASMAVLIYAPPLPPSLIAFLCFLIGFFGSSQIACFALVRAIHPPDVISTAIGLVNGMITGAGALFQPLIGLLLDVAWTGETSAGARVYDRVAFTWALSSLIVVVAAGLSAALVLRDADTRHR